MGKAIKKEKETKTIEEKTIVNVEKIYEIHTPNKSYTGLNCAVEFKNGVGVTKNDLIADYFKNKGYEVKEI